ncbi:MAG: hypothetical protein E7425_07565 [Ruminococcaceae bacterium]|jgi:vacuolar-type H+-ATPase subunit I/STV1|nr:hypothetical protein [Oscillospiraceae bacterium]
MTDFIHERPREQKTEEPVPSPAPEEGELDERTGQKRVYGYIFLLFIVAFFLLLWSFLMNQRSNEQVISELRGSTGTIQSTLDQNIALERRVAELEAEKEQLEVQIEALDKEKESLQAQLHTRELDAGQAEQAQAETDAARCVYYAAVLASEERYREAAAELADWNTAEFEQLLSDHDEKARHYAGENEQSALTHPYYDALIEQLAELGYLTVDANGQLTVTEPTG